MVKANSIKIFTTLQTLLLNRYLLFVGVLYLYAKLSAYYFGLNDSMFSQQWLELLIALYLFSYLYAILRPGRWRALLAALPVLLGYLIHDIYYLMYGKILRLIEVKELPELVQVLTAGQALLLIIGVGVPLLLLLLAVNYRKPRIIALGALPLALLVIDIHFAPDSFASGFKQLSNPVVTYSDRMSVENNGRYSMMLLREAQRISAREKTAPYHDRPAYEQQTEALANAIRKDGNGRNVHLIVMESFLDPTLFQKAAFSLDPVHPDFTSLFGSKVGLSISPVFGGATSQAEFEVLCGVPALGKLSSVEFNVFTGARTHCMPGVLERAGYRTVATNGYKPDFFNTLPAYKGIGFDEANFPRKHTSLHTYLDVEPAAEEGYIFDGDLLQKNLDYVAAILKEHPEKPLLNYVLTIYGHTPHDLDPALRPEILQVQSDYSDDHLQRAANQFYYRTEAIARYVRDLIEVDKNSIIILVSDHVPPLRNGLNTYRELDYVDSSEDSYYYNRLLVLKDGKPQVYPTMHHYDIPDLILDYLTDGKHCRERACAYVDGDATPKPEIQLAEYFLLMAHASETL
jgi:phosphoglycerol transferase MdoB-like AlkP superfamily enzyme